MKQSRKMYGCKLCKTLYSELHKAPNGNLRTTNISIELHIERDHPGVLLNSAVDHITKFSKVSEARAALVAEGYSALLGPKAKSEDPGVLDTASDNGSIIATPARSSHTSMAKKGVENIPRSAPRKSLVVILKVSTPLQLTPPASVIKVSDQSLPDQSSRPPAVADKQPPTIPNKLKVRQTTKAKRGQEWLKTLDRSGEPCRKWVREPFEVRSFTNYTFRISAWQEENIVTAPDVKEPKRIALVNHAEPSSPISESIDIQKQKVDSHDSLLQQENALRDDPDRLEAKEAVRCGSKLTPKILGDSNSTETRQSPNSQKRAADSEIDNTATKKSKTVRQKAARC